MNRFSYCVSFALCVFFVGVPRTPSGALAAPQVQGRGDVHFVDRFHYDVVHDRTTIAPVGDDDPPVCNDTNSNRYDALSCWLWKLKLEMPDQQVEKLKIKVNVRSLMCSNFSLQEIDSDYIPSSSTTNPIINLSLKGISAACSGKYHVSPGGMAGGITTKANSNNDNGNQAIVLKLNFVSDYKYPNATELEGSNNDSAKKYYMPTAFQTSQCQSYLRVAGLHFTGSISARLANVFKGMIEDTVTSQLNGLLCPRIQQVVDPQVTNILLSADKLLAKYVPQNRLKQHQPQDSNHAEPRLSTGLALEGNDSASVHRSPQIHIPSSLEQSNSSVIDFEKDTPFLLKSLQKINHFLDCFYNVPSMMGLNGNSQNCQSIITKGIEGISSAIVENLADEVELPLPDIVHNIHFELKKLGKIQLDIQDLHIKGLDQMDRLILFSPLIGANSSSGVSQFQSQLNALAGLNFTANVNITIYPIPGGIVKGDPLNEYVHVDFNTSNLNALGNVGLLLNRDRFQHIQVGTVLDSLPGYFHEHARNASSERRCLFDSIQSLIVNDLQLQVILEAAAFVPKLGDSKVKHVQANLLTEKLEADLDALVNRMFQLVLKEYQSFLGDAASGLVELPLLNKVNQWIDQNLKGGQFHRDYVAYNDADSLFRVEGEKRCSSGDELIDKDHHSLANFSQLDSLDSLNRYINKPSSLVSINKAIDRWASGFGKNQGRGSAWKNQLNQLASWQPNLETKLPGVSIRLQHLHLDNLGTLFHIDLLAPERDGMHLKSGFSLGVDGNKSATGAPTVHVSINVLYGPRNLNATINATISLQDVFLDGGSILRLDTTRLRQLTMSQILSQWHCVAAPFQQLDVYNTRNVSRIGYFLGNVTASVTGTSTFENFTAFLDTVEYPDVAAAITSTVAWTINVLRNGINSATHSTFEQAEGYCTGGEKFGYDDDPPILDDGYTDGLLLPVMLVCAAAYVAFNACFLLVAQCSSSSGASTEDLASTDLAEPLLVSHNVEDHGSGAATKTFDGPTSNGSLMQSTAISAISRHAVPILITCTIMLLVSGNAGCGATVDLYITWNDGSRTLSLPSLFTFSLVNTAQNMWNAHIYPLFFLVVLMSGIWPYLKLLLMFGSWTMPTTRMSSKTRERLLLTMDALGKFALADTYLFVLFMVAFRYHLEVSGNVAVDVFVSPQTGFYTFLAATCFSLLVGHFMIYCHRVSEMWHLIPRLRDSRLRQGKHRESVLGHQFCVWNSVTGEDDHLRLSRRFCVFLLSATAMAAVLLAVGITQKSFRFEIGGIAGDMLGEDRVEYYSLLSLGSSLRKSVRDPSSRGIILLQCTYYFYAVVTPFACLGLLVLLLVCPMTLPYQRFVLTLGEIANAWSAVEVFVISIIASLLEISTFASFIIGDKCDLINKILKEYFMSALDNASDATCFTVRSSVETSAGFLIAGVLVNSFVVSLVLRLVHCSVAERIDEEMESSLLEQSLIVDPLRSDAHPRTVTSSLSSIGSILKIREVIFEIPDTTPILPQRSDGYLPQSTDTYSVQTVNWDDATTQTGEDQRPTPNRSVPPPPPETSNVLETIHSAFD